MRDLRRVCAMQLPLLHRSLLSFLTPLFMLACGAHRLIEWHFSILDASARLEALGLRLSLAHILERGCPPRPHGKPRFFQHDELQLSRHHNVPGLWERARWHNGQPKMPMEWSKHGAIMAQASQASGTVERAAGRAPSTGSDATSGATSGADSNESTTPAASPPAMDRRLSLLGVDAEVEAAAAAVRAEEGALAETAPWRRVAPHTRIDPGWPGRPYLLSCPPRTTQEECDMLGGGEPRPEERLLRARGGYSRGSQCAAAWL
jgi:hypothetical protein